MKILSNFRDILTSPNFYIPVIVAIALIVFGHVYESVVQGTMNVTLFKVGGMEIDWWAFSHFLLYAYFGYYFPDYFIEFFIIGTLWEIFEGALCHKSFYHLLNCKNSNNFICQRLNEIGDCKYWYGRIDDIVMNTLGFVVGMVISKKWKK